MLRNLTSYYIPISLYTYYMLLIITANRLLSFKWYVYSSAVYLSYTYLPTTNNTINATHNTIMKGRREEGQNGIHIYFAFVITYINILIYMYICIQTNYYYTYQYI